MNLDTQGANSSPRIRKCDVGGVLAHPTEKNIQAVSFTYDRTEWKILDDCDRRGLSSSSSGLQDGEIIVTSRTQDDKQWTVAYILDNGPVKFYRYIR